MLLADVSFGEVLWSMVAFFFLVILLWILFGVIMDIFRSDDMSGGMKAVWCIFLLLMPWLAVFIYLIARGKGMGQRQMATAQKHQAQMDAYVRETAGSAGPSNEIASAKTLLDAGTITQDEFDRLKAAALAKA
jgi:hypothetical protein